MLVARPARETEPTTGGGIERPGPRVREYDRSDEDEPLVRVGTPAHPPTVRLGRTNCETRFTIEVLDLAEIVAGTTEAVGPLLDSRGTG